MNKKAIFAFAFAMVTSLSFVTSHSKGIVNSTLAQLANGVYRIAEIYPPTSPTAEGGITAFDGTRYRGMLETLGSPDLQGTESYWNGYLIESFPDGSSVYWAY